MINLKPDNPLVLTFRGHTPALKNTRNLFLNPATGKISLSPSKSVQIFLKNGHGAINRQLQDQFNGVWTPSNKSVAVVAFVYVAYKSEFPKSDLDNSYTTLQEALQGTVIEDDRQIEVILAVRKQVEIKQHEFAQLFVWETQFDSKNILTVFSEIHKFSQYMKEQQIELGNFDENNGSESGINTSLNISKDDAWF